MKKIVSITLAVLGLLAFGTRMDAQESKTHPTIVVNRSGKATLLYHPLKNYIGTGKPTLLCFWISEDEQCREEIAALQPLYRKYKDSGLVVVGVPIDAEIDPTMDAITELGVTYPQLCDMDEELYERYGVQGLPYIVLLGPDGTVIASDLHGEAVEEAVKGALK